ncbi:SMP-30/gluconolactonase/LRE family protein [Halalkalibacter sp. AB-rgal2]|uniref:SMP-30/gluconolactonase/LRE family protein n=1 Tax=Halalkalibacter sp. AB-rgal2 TaxID=3242695 RepID=UPI00359E6E40
MIETSELIIDAKATLGESPSWDEKLQVLYWVDIIEKKCFIYDPSNHHQKTLQLGQMVGAVAPNESGGLITALESGFYFYNSEANTTEFISNPEEGINENRFNDGKCDPAGRFWAGTMSLKGHKEKGALYCLEPNLSSTKKLDHISISNGLAWSPDNQYMYYIDTPTQRVVRFNYDITNGQVTNQTEIITIEKSTGSPDGMTIDQEGMLWIAHWGGAKISRWNPTSGEHLLDIPIPALNVTSCVFGGQDLTDLYITTARMNDEQYEHAGGLFRIKTNIQGSPTHRFKKNTV